MSDEQTNVNAGSETSGEQAAETLQETTAAAPTDASTERSEETSTDAGGAAVQTTAPAADESRTGFVSNARTGDACICPDGRKGTVHSFDAGFVCIPNHDQG